MAMNGGHGSDIGQRRVRGVVAACVALSLLSDILPSVPTCILYRTPGMHTTTHNGHSGTLPGRRNPSIGLGHLLGASAVIGGACWEAAWFGILAHSC